MKMNKTYPKVPFLILFSSLCFAVLGPLPAHAAKFQFNSFPDAVGVGDILRIDATLIPEGKRVNAVEGAVTFPSAFFEFRKITDGESAIPLWVERPELKTSGRISFSGIFPSGFEGIRAPLFSFYVKMLKEGRAVVDFSEMRLLENDGNGTDIPFVAAEREIRISGTTSSAPISLPEDIFPPEPFVPLVSRDADIFEGKWFIAFSTTDKQSGVDRFDVAEIPPGAASDGDVVWERAESPYLIKDQTRSKDLYVRAIDRYGNFVVAKIPASFSPQLKAHKNRTVGMILLVIIGCLTLYYGVAWLKSKRR